MSASKVVYLFWSASIFLLLSTPSVCDFCGVENLPEFRSMGHLQNDGLPNRVAALIPSYVFSCAGYIKQWRAHVEAWESGNDLYQLTFSVWRRTNRDGNCTYTKVGENRGEDVHHGLVPESGTGIVTLNVSSEKRVRVQPGDFVGFQSHYYLLGSPGGPGGTESHGASVAVDPNRTNVTVWYRSSPLEQRCISEEDFVPLSPLSDQLLPLSAAPVIDVAVDMLLVPLDPIPSTSSSVPTSTITSSPTSTSAVVSSTPLHITPPVTTSTSSSTAAVPIVIITIAVIISLLLCILSLLPLLLCVVVVRRKQKQPKGQTPYTSSSGMMQNYLYLSSKTMPGHYKRNDPPANCHVYDTLSPTAPEPLPVLNPALLSNSDSISTTSSASPNDYELMYSAVLPTWRNQPGHSSTECPLYSSILQDAYESKIYSNTEEPAYDVISAADLERNSEQPVVYDVVNDELLLEGQK